MTDPRLELLVTELESGLLAGTRQGLWQSSRAVEELMLTVPGIDTQDSARLKTILARCQRLCTNANEWLGGAGESYGKAVTSNALSCSGWEG